MKNRILLVEPDVEYAQRCIQELQKANYVVNHISRSIIFWRVFNQFKDEWLILVMCGYLDNYAVCCDELVREVRRRTNGRIKIIANAVNPEMNKMLMNAGCSTRASGSRFRSYDLPNVVQGTLRFATD